MNTRTFEIIGKWIAKKHKISIEYKTGCVPTANMENNHIVMPSDIPKVHQYNALTTLMHEAAHLNHSKKDLPKDLVKDSLAHDILNVIEDVRVDRKNMGILYNVGEFYKRSVAYDIEKRKPMLDKIPLHKKVLINAIYNLEWLPEGIIQDKDAQELEQKGDIENKIEQAINQIERKDWTGVQKSIENIIKALGIQGFPRMPITQVCIGGMGEGQGDGKGKCPACNGTGKIGGTNERQGTKEKGGTAQGVQGDKKGEPCPVCGGSGTADCDIRGIKEAYDGSGSGQGSGSGCGNSAIGEVAMREVTRQKFKELLCIKEIHKTEDNAKLNTGSLTSFMTGDIDELFHDEEEFKVRKSKILLLLDASGSMGSMLPMGGERRAVVGGCCKELVNILTELQELEGLGVDYDVHAFTGSYHELKKENWEKRYCQLSGGTDLINAFAKGQEFLLKDAELDGQKLIVVFTDGEVDDDEIAEMRKRILRHGAEVRCMVIGVGAELTSYFVDHIVGDLNIIAKESADQILMDAITVMMSE